MPGVPVSSEDVAPWVPGKRSPEYSQIMLWEHTAVSPADASVAADFVKEVTGAQHPVVFVGVVRTLPGLGGPGGRPDAMFLIHVEDIACVAVGRFRAMAQGGREFGNMRWWEDVFYNGQQHIYPEAFREAYPPMW